MKRQRTDRLQTAELAEAIHRGDRYLLARTITMLESTRPSDRLRAMAVLGHGARPPKLRIGITGPPGVGKSTFIDAFGTYLTGLQHRVAVLAIDPTSPKTGGSVLGDKTRMPRLARSDRAFVRPTPSRGTAGGIAATTLDTVRLCEMAGYDHVLVETVGAGQATIAIRAVADIILLLVQPGAGDELQGIKRGILELADVILVTKADGEGKHTAGATKLMYRRALRSLPVEICSGLTGSGMERSWKNVDTIYHRLSKSGELVARRKEAAKEAVTQALTDALLEDCLANADAYEAMQAANSGVASGEISCLEAAQTVLQAYRGP